MQHHNLKAMEQGRHLEVGEVGLNPKRQHPPKMATTQQCGPGPEHGGGDCLVSPIDSVTQAHHSMRESIIALFDNLSRLATRLEPILAADSNVSGREPQPSSSCELVAEMRQTEEFVFGAQTIVGSIHDRLRL